MNHELSRKKYENRSLEKMSNHHFYKICVAHHCFMTSGFGQPKQSLVHGF